MFCPWIHAYYDTAQVGMEIQLHTFQIADVLNIFLTDTFVAQLPNGPNFHCNKVSVSAPSWFKEVLRFTVILGIIQIVFNNE